MKLEKQRPTKVDNLRYRETSAHLLAYQTQRTRQAIQFANVKGISGMKSRLETYRVSLVEKKTPYPKPSHIPATPLLTN